MNVTGQTIVVVVVVVAVLRLCVSDQLRTVDTGDEGRYLVDFCPSSCACSRRSNTALLTVNCSNRQLQAVPSDLPADTGELLLDHNNIETLSNGDLEHCARLEILDISYNNITKVNINALHLSSRSLRELYFNDNVYLAIENVAAMEIFQALASLAVLSLQNTNIGCTDEFLRNLFSLTTLSIDRSENVMFEDSFLFLSNLTSLTLYGPMRLMSNDTFLNLVNCPLTKLSIKSSNTLSVLEPLTFSPLSHLETLDLSYNNGLGLTNASKAWYGLIDTNITTLILSYIVVSNEVSPKIKKSFYEHIGLCNIKTLLLDRNNIEEIEPGFANAFPNLEHFDFSFNILQRGTFQIIYEFSFLHHLVFVDFSNQVRKYLDKRNVKVKQYMVSNNYAFEKSFQTNASHNEIDTSSCQIAKWKPCNLDFVRNSLENDKLFGPSVSVENAFGPSARVEDDYFCAFITNKLEVLNLSASITIRNVKLYQITILGNISSLKKIVYKSNRLSSLTGPILFGSATLTPISFDISDNDADCISPDLFKAWILSQSTQAFGEVILANNKLGKQLELDNDGMLFKYYRNLSILDLSSNNIRSLPYKVFVHVPFLKVLSLKGNSLRILGFQMTHFYNLEKLDLSNNLITNLKEESLQILNQLISSFNTSINFNGNPIECSCDSLPVLRWMSKTRRNLYNLEGLSCIVNNTDIKFKKLETFILVHLEFSCSKNLILKVTGALLGIAILAVVLSVFLFRHRWDIRYFMLQLRKNSNKYIRLLDLSSRYEYDAFVSYHNKDVYWVRNELQAKLEGPEECNNEAEAVSSTSDGTNDVPLRLCIHQRDFDVGETIQDNILTSIEQSKRVILVISRHFLESEWCLFELELARKQSLVREINIIIPVVLESVELEKMPPTLQWLFRTNTYIEWIPHSSEKPYFFRRLRRALAEPFQM